MARPISNFPVTGKKYGSWRVLGSILWKRSIQYWLVSCKCGTEKYVNHSKLIHGESKSCKPCSKTIHNKRFARIYNIFHHILQRCNNPNNKSYPVYGGRGIRLLWEDFESFLKDMGSSYEEHVKTYGEKNTLIERIDSNGNYCRENCRWATWKEQQNNRTNNHRIFAFGEELTLTQWAERYGMKVSRLHSRITRSKMPIEIALTTPLRKC
jgi:hypothetical protein